jgi:hypothetical protein
MDIKVDWATWLQNFLQLDVQSFDELLKTVTLTIIKRNTTLQEAIFSSQCLIHLATRNTFWRCDIYKCCISVHCIYFAEDVFTAQ